MASSRPLSTLPIAANIQIALRRAGYATIGDLKGVSGEILVAELKISQKEAEKLVEFASVNPSISDATTTFFPSSQSVSSMLTVLRVHRTGSGIFDRLIDDGLRKGQCLEIAGPPGSGKSSFALEIIRHTVREGNEVLVIDCLNNMRPARLVGSVGPLAKDLVHRVTVAGFHELLGVVNQLPSYLCARPSISLIAITSLSNPFQLCPNNATKTRLQALIKNALSKLSSTHNLAFVVTMQLSTKLLNPDGSTGSFDTGAKAIMVPALGHDWYPREKTYKIILSRNHEGRRQMHLQSAPSPLKNPPHNGLGYIIDENGRIVFSPL